MNGCPRCPKGQKEPCTERRHSCRDCNGMGLVPVRPNYWASIGYGACKCMQEAE